MGKQYRGKQCNLLIVNEYSRAKYNKPYVDLTEKEQRSIVRACGKDSRYEKKKCTHKIGKKEQDVSTIIDDNKEELPETLQSETN